MTKNVIPATRDSNILAMPNQNRVPVIFILLELLLGVIGGIIYIDSPGSPTQSLMDSILNSYLILNALFFGATVLPGIVSAVILKRTDRLVAAILVSLVTGIGFLLLHAFAIPIPVFAFFSLPGFILGFNYYLLKNSRPEKK